MNPCLRSRVSGSPASQSRLSRHNYLYNETGSRTAGLGIPLTGGIQRAGDSAASPVNGASGIPKERNRTAGQAGMVDLLVLEVKRLNKLRVEIARAEAVVAHEFLVEGDRRLYAFDNKFIQCVVHLLDGFVPCLPACNDFGDQ